MGTILKGTKAKAKAKARAMKAVVSMKFQTWYLNEHSILFWKELMHK